MTWLRAAAFVAALVLAVALANRRLARRDEWHIPEWDDMAVVQPQ